MKTLISIFCILLCYSATQAQEIIYLYENGAPGFEDKKDIPEQAKDYWVKSVHNPSITIYKPETPNGASVLIFPGGGHRILVINSEGRRAAEYLNSLGITAAVVKYRLFREEGSSYTIEHAKEDGLMALKVMKQNADRLGIDASSIGVMGFSAGGEVVNLIAYNEELPPAFNIQVYPGPLAIPSEVSKNAPPAFLIASNNDECCSESIVELMQAYRKAGAQVELHMYAKGDHAFNMGTKSDFKTISNWPDRLAEWFEDYEYFRK